MSNLLLGLLGLYFGGVLGIGGLTIFILSLYSATRKEKWQYALLTIFWPASVSLLIVMRVILGADVYSKLRETSQRSDRYGQESFQAIASDVRPETNESATAGNNYSAPNKKLH